MRGSVGLLIGVAIGAGGMYLALKQPWAGEASPAAPLDAGVAESPPSDAGPVAKKKKRKRGRAGGGGNANGPLPTIDSTFGPDDPGGDDYEETEPLPELSAMDRKMETRGDDITLPPTKIDMAGGGAARSLDDGEINAVIGSQAGGVRDCVVKGATNTDLRAQITVQLVVGGNGRVTKTRVQAPRYLFEKGGLLNCVRGAAGKMKFPAVGAATLVTVPVSLS